MTFDIGTDVDKAAQLVNNRVKQAEAKLPQEVRRQGVTVEKGSSAFLQVLAFYSPDGRYDADYELDGLDYPIGYVRWTENRNMQAYLRLLAEKALTSCVSGRRKKGFGRPSRRVSLMSTESMPVLPWVPPSAMI